MILTPLPGSQQYKNMVEEKRLLTNDWGLYDAHHVVYQPKLMSPLELQVESMRAMASFYSIGQILQSVSKLDLIGVFLKSYAHNLTRSWRARNKYYHEVVKQMKTDAADRVNLTWARTRDDIARRVQEFKDRSAAAAGKAKGHK